MNTRFGLVLAALVGLTLSMASVQPPAAAQSRYSIITEDGVPGELVQPPRKKLKKKTVPEAPEAQKKQPSNSNYSSRSQADAKKKLLDEQTVTEAGSSDPAVKKKKANEIFDLFGNPATKAKKQQVRAAEKKAQQLALAQKKKRLAIEAARLAAAKKAQETALAEEKERL